MFGDREMVRALHQAYADKTESFLGGLRQAPGDPCEVRIRRFGPARTSIARGHDWISRATFTGDEDLDLVDEVIAYYADQNQRCLVEWNPGNCYRSGTWDDALGRHLLAKGFLPGGFRCVWAAETETAVDHPKGDVEVRSFSPTELEDYLRDLAEMRNPSEAEAAETRRNVHYGEGGGDWRHYVGRFGEIPFCDGSMYVGDGVAYFEWGGTVESHRSRGGHTALIRRRLTDARKNGCGLVFAVTDIGVPSSRNLQREGFRLAYNYVMLVREPPALR